MPAYVVFKPIPFRVRWLSAISAKPRLARSRPRNCQPFVRELGGVWHCFAHNGNLPGIASDSRFRAAEFRTVGETDSEQAFCALMDALRPLWLTGATPSLDSRKQVVAGFGAALRRLGPANFLYSDSDALFAHADRRHQGDESIRPPGLWRLARRCAAGGELAADGLRIASDSGEQEVFLVASVPLTAEKWGLLAEGELLVARHGRLQEDVSASGGRGPVSLIR